MRGPKRCVDAAAGLAHALEQWTKAAVVLLFRNMLKDGTIFHFSMISFPVDSVVFLRSLSLHEPNRQSIIERSDVMHASRPKHLNLMQIRLPLPAFVSILHRVSGAVLFLLLPLLLCLLGSSLESANSFLELKKWVSNPLAKVVLLGVLWAYLHHFFAGIRHLAMDLHIGLELPAARAASYAVLGASLALTVIIGWRLW